MPLERANDDLRSLLTQTERLLERWEFSISTAGFFYARPIGRSLDLDDLTAFTERLRMIYDDDFPDVITFDLCDVVVPDSEWRPMRRMLRRFARSIGGRLRTVSIQGRSAGILIVCRCGRKDHPAGPRISN